MLNRIPGHTFTINTFPSEFVTKEVFDWAVKQCRKKKLYIDISNARFESFTEGLCAQIMHIGSYGDGRCSIDQITDFINGSNLKKMTGDIRKRHEIYYRTQDGHLRKDLKPYCVFLFSMQKHFNYFFFCFRHIVIADKFTIIVIYDPCLFVFMKAV